MIRRSSKKPPYGGRRFGADKAEDALHGGSHNFLRSSSRLRRGLTIFLAIPTATNKRTRRRASVSASSGSRSPRQDQLRPLRIMISSTRSVVSPLDRDLPGEISRDLLPIAIFTARSIVTSMLKIVKPARSQFMSPSYSRCRRHDFWPTGRETLTDKEKRERGERQSRGVKVGRLA
ncbi:hypothetical protein TIFTF001_007868 [Ficus carica]|uniref:Uncharacterized protein n=1 Tax=Ficus carica TaxID=3494 RepID=A0AA88DGP4_FICCA|nr:hypothetical protein TIFTF001_007868 [Ficus carica]